MRRTGALLNGHVRLLRDFITESLYHPTAGYFSKQAPVGFLDPPINFPALSGRQAYLAEVQRRYAALQVAWLTPVEIFSPHLGAAVARYLSAQHDASKKAQKERKEEQRPLTIFEIGGGTGTLARDILSWLSTNRPDLHAYARYCCVEISPTLAGLQRTRVAGLGAFSVVHGDAAEAATWTAAAEAVQYDPDPSNPCFVLAMEVLDNLPHDRVWQEGPGAPWLETVVARDSGIGPSIEQNNLGEGENGRNLGYKEILRPIEDPLVARCLSAWEELNGGKTAGGGSLAALIRRVADRALGAALGEAVFLPTGALRLFDALHAALPQSHRLLAADFDALPETVIPGIGAPLVASTVDGTTIDHGTYLVSPGTADIFFPSDFELLTRLYRASGGENTAAYHVKASEFFEEWAPEGPAEAERRCADGYDPLIADYSNTAVLVT